jgi:hypothetical protein
MYLLVAVLGSLGKHCDSMFVILWQNQTLSFFVFDKKSICEIQAYSETFSAAFKIADPAVGAAKLACR